MNEVNERIKQKRKDLGWTLQEASAKFGLTITGYAQMENGKSSINIDRLYQIAEVFGVSVGELLGLEGVQAVPNGEQASEIDALKKENERLQREVQDLRELKEGLEILIKAQVSKLPNEELKKNALVGSAMGAILALGTYLEFHFNELKERGFDFSSKQPKGEPPTDFPVGW